MSASVSPIHCRRNGERRTSVAIAPGMCPLDAAYHTAQDYPGGVPALALRMGVSANTLQHKLNVNNTTHRLTLQEAEQLLHLTGDTRITQALAAVTGGVYLSQQALEQSTPMAQAMCLVKEFGDVLGSVNAAVADGVVTLNELRQCEREVAELMAALNATLGVVRSMLPAATQPVGVRSA